MSFQTATIAAGPSASRSARGPGESLLLTENATLVGGPRPLLQTLSEREREIVLSHGRRRVLYRGQTLFSQGAVHDGIHLVESGRIRVFYTAPSGREITLAYWNAGNFVGGPEVFGSSPHLWSGVAAANSVVFLIPGKALRRLVSDMPALAIGVIEGLSFKGKCYSALAQMLGTRSVTERLAHLLLHLGDLYGLEEDGDIVIRAGFTHAELAHMVGATRQWVTISLKRMQQQGILTADKARLVIHRPDQLQGLKGAAA